MDMIIGIIEWTCISLFLALFIFVTRERVALAYIRWHLSLFIGNEKARAHSEGWGEMLRIVDRYVSFPVVAWFVSYTICIKYKVSPIEPMLASVIVAICTLVCCVIWFVGKDSDSKEEPDNLSTGM